MLTDPALRSKVESLWDKLWSGGLSNPLDAIEQLSFLLFLKRLDEREQDNERAAGRRKTKGEPIFPDPKLRWSYWTQLPADKALAHVKEKVFPFIKTLGGKGGSFAGQMENAEFKINKPSLLVEACKAIDGMEISSQNQDVQGDLYEYLLSKLNTAGQNGQFRTPRHIIRMMVRLVDPRPGDRVCDPAAGTCGFLVNAYQHVLERNTRPDVLTYDENGDPHHLVGDKLSADQHAFLQTQALTGYDNDSGMTMLRIGSMNLMLHGIASPNFRYADTLSKAFDEEKQYDVVLANPPFKGAIDSTDVNPTLPAKCRKTEILFLHLFLRLLENGGRAAVIVPDGVLFGSSGAHVEVRRKLIEENRLDAVVSMPAGVFRPYAGVSTAVLVFTKGGTTERIWFYDMEHDGFSLDDKRQRVPENDIPDLLDCWKNRRDAKFLQKRSNRLAALREEIAPLKAARLEHHATIHRLRFEEVIAADGDADKARTAREQAEAELGVLQTKIGPLEKEINQLGRQFWVSKDQAKANKYDLSASRYRQVEHEEEYYEDPAVTLERLEALDNAASETVASIRGLSSRT
jgi:type I restriction enzyme M protein